MRDKPKIFTPPTPRKRFQVIRCTPGAEWRVVRYAVHLTLEAGEQSAKLQKEHPFGHDQQV
jgi:hypothetical protein